MKKLAKITGSSLISAMIFGFVVLVTVSGLVYLVKYNLLSIKSLVNQEKVLTIEQQYIQSIADTGSIKVGKINLGDYDFENTLESSQVLFSNQNIDVSLYNAQAVAISSNIIHKLFYKNNLEISKKIIYKSLPKHSMLNYPSSFVAINVPYIDINKMTNLQQFYHLNAQGQISDIEQGFIGFIDKEYSWFLISVNNHTQVISLKDLDLSSDYKIKLGWHLYKGRWQMLLAIYDKEHLYILRANLDDLINHFDKAVLDLSNSIKIVDVPTDIVALSWNYLKDTTNPSLAVLTTHYDSNGNMDIVVKDLEFDKLKNAYVTSIKDSISYLGDIKDKNIYILAIDPRATLASTSLYVFVGDRMIVYSFDKSNKIKKTIMLLNSVIQHPPKIVKKDAYSYYILIYDKDRYYQYSYTKNSHVINIGKPIIYPKQNIQDIIVKYGLKFIVTNKNVYISDFNNNQLEKLSI